MRRYCPQADSYHQRKLLRTQLTVVATKSLAAKIAKACYYIMKDQVDFDVTKIFGKPIKPNNKGCGSKPDEGLDNRATNTEIFFSWTCYGTSRISGAMDIARGIN